MMCSRLHHGGVRRGRELRVVIGGEGRCMSRGEGACTRRMRKRDGGGGRSRVSR